MVAGLSHMTLRNSGHLFNANQSHLRLYSDCSRRERKPSQIYTKSSIDETVIALCVDIKVDFSLIPVFVYL